MNDSIAVWQPVSVLEALKLKEKYQKNAQFIAGGTLLQLQREQGLDFPPHLISLEQISQLSEIKKLPDGALSIGALANFEICRHHSLIQQYCPALVKAVGTIAAPAVRNRGTIGGNILYGIGDTIPLLLVLNASIRWNFQSAVYTESLLDYTNRKTPPHESAILSAVILPADSKSSFVFFQKIGRREMFIPSVVTIAMYAAFQKQTFTAVRLAAGGGVSRPHRLRKCEKLLEEKQLSKNLLRALHSQIQEEAELITDAFASSDYRKLVAANLINAQLELLYPGTEGSPR